MNYDLCLHIDSNDVSMLRFVMVNARNYINGLPGQKFNLVIVANGPAVTLLTNAKAEELFETAKTLNSEKVRFCACANALAATGTDKDKLWPFVEVVPAGLVEVVRLQREGYAYIKP